MKSLVYEERRRDFNSLSQQNRDFQCDMGRVPFLHLPEGHGECGPSIAPTSVFGEMRASTVS